MRRCRRPSDRGRPGLLTSRDNAVIHVWRSASRTGDVKTPQSKHSLELPRRAVTALQAHRKHQAAERLAAGAVWHDNDLVFCHEDGRMYASDALNWALRQDDQGEQASATGTPTKDATLPLLPVLATRTGTQRSPCRLRDHLAGRPGESLPVVDKAASADLVRPFLLAAGGTHVVITSTSRAFAEPGTVVDVGGVQPGGVGGAPGGPDQARRDPAEAGEVAAELGELPLGLAQAATVIAGQHLTYPEYLQRLRRMPVAEVLGRVPGGDYPHAAAAALLLNATAAPAKDPSGRTFYSQGSLTSSPSGGRFMMTRTT